MHLVFSPTAKPLPVPVPGSRKAVLRQLRRFFGFRLKDDRLVLLLGDDDGGADAAGPVPDPDPDRRAGLRQDHPVQA